MDFIYLKIKRNISNFSQFLMVILGSKVIFKTIIFKINKMLKKLWQIIKHKILKSSYLALKVITKRYKDI